MKKISWNEGWKFYKEGMEERMDVVLPHDAQIHEERTMRDPLYGGHGYFPGGCYYYEKSFHVPEDWKGQTAGVEFEGIYKNAEVFLNGKPVAKRPYGYSNFYVPLDGLLYGRENILTVKADNSKLPNSRWYTGSGIYRPVWFYRADKAHIAWQGLKITTLEIQPAKVRIEVKIADGGQTEADRSMKVSFGIFDREQCLVRTGCGISAGGMKVCADVEIAGAELWSDEAPKLYRCEAVLMDSEGGIVDTVSEMFGIRKITWNTGGFFVNGVKTFLRGGCIHHDQGILGAATYDKSEERRVKIMKEAGFNAIRSSHNPASRALLEACDRYGMYVMDETFDMWYNRKNVYDYGCDFEEWWERDTRAMVERDYNHPCVVLYSIGNEVAEPAEAKGLAAGRKMIELIHKLDATRPVTCGANLMVMSKASKGKGIYQDGEMDVSVDTGKAKKEDNKSSNGSLAFNMMASIIGTGMNKAGNSKKVDKIASPFLDSLDIAGYNYGSGRYLMEGKLHPGRVIFGSETFPQDIYKNWKVIEENPYIIGDFMWTSWDYIGEAGLGAWSYTGGMPFNRPYPWLLSGTGVIDITGIPDASCRYAAVVWGKCKSPVIGVRPVNHQGIRPSKSVWRGTNAVESWSFRDCDGNDAVVEVYADEKGGAVYAELLVNDKLVGRKKLKEDKALFKTKYEKGRICARITDRSGRVIAKKVLQSAEGDIRIVLCPEESVVKRGEIVYIPVELQGSNKVIESNRDEQLQVTVNGGEFLAFGSGNPCTKERYDSGNFTTYMGRALIIVRAKDAGEIQISVTGRQGEAVTSVRVE